MAFISFRDSPVPMRGCVKCCETLSVILKTSAQLYLLHRAYQVSFLVNTFVPLVFRSRAPDFTTALQESLHPGLYSASTSSDMDSDEIMAHLRHIGAISLNVEGENELRQFLSAFCSQRTKEDVSGGALKPRRMLGTDLFLTAIDGYNLPPHVFVLPPSAAFLFMNAAQHSTKTEDLAMDVNSHPMFKAIQDFCEVQETVPTVIVPTYHDIHSGILIARDGGVFWGDSSNTMPLSGKKMKKLFSLFLKVLKAACPSVSWSLKNENYMTEFLGYVSQTDSYSCGFYVLAAVSEFAPDDSPVRHESYRRHQHRRTADLRDSVVRYFVSQVLSELALDRSPTYQDLLTNINRELPERSGCVLSCRVEQLPIDIDAEEEECEIKSTESQTGENSRPLIANLVAWLEERACEGEIWTNATAKAIKDETISYAGSVRVRCIEYRRVGCEACMYFKLRRNWSGWDIIISKPHSGHSGPSVKSQRDMTIRTVDNFISSLKPQV